MLTIALAIIVGVGVFGAVWFNVTKNTNNIFGKGTAMTFTPDDGKGGTVPFDLRHERYMKIAEVVTTLASASVIFVPSSRLSAYPHSCAFTIILLGFSVFYCIGFMVALTYFYEEFLYFKSSYSALKYGVVHAPGLGGLFCFAFAYIALAMRVGWALMYTAPSN
jgi:hypothetical protein